jgi:hypothetical protein
MVNRRRHPQSGPIPSRNNPGGMIWYRSFSSYRQLRWVRRRRMAGIGASASLLDARRRSADRFESSRSPPPAGTAPSGATFDVEVLAGKTSGTGASSFPPTWGLGRRAGGDAKGEGGGSMRLCARETDQEILAKIRPEPAREPPPPLKHYEPPRATAARRRRAGR